MRALRLLLFAGLGLALTVPGRAQAQQEGEREVEGSTTPRPFMRPFFRTFTSEDLGLSSTNYRVAVLPSGLVYVANAYGIVEYDGETWRRIPQPQITQSMILAADASGRIWGSLRGSLSRLEPDATGALQLVDYTDRLPPEHRKPGQLNSTLLTPEGLWAYSISRLILIPEKGEVRVWRAEADIESLFSLNGVVHVTQTNRGISRVEGSKLVPVSTGTLRTVPPIFAARALPGEPTRQMLLTRLGPYTWDGPGTEPKPLSARVSELFREPVAPFRSYPATKAIFLPDGRMVFGGHGGLGFVVLRSDGEVQYQLKKPDGLHTGWINDLAADNQGGIWLAHPSAVTRVQVDSPYVDYGGSRGLNGPVRDVARHHDQLYLAHSEGVLVATPAGPNAFRLLGDLPTNTNGASRFLTSGNRLYVTASGLREVLPTGRLRRLGSQYIFEPHASRRQPGWLLGVERSTINRRLWLYAPGTTASSLRAIGPVAAVIDPDRFGFEDDDGRFWGTTMQGRVWRADFRDGLSAEAPAEYFDTGITDTENLETTTAVVFPFAGGVEVGGAGRLWRFDAAARRFIPETRIAGLPPMRGFMPPITGADGSRWFLYQGYPHAPETRIFRITPDGPDRWVAREFPTGPVRRLLVNNLYEEPDRHTLWLATMQGVVAADTTWQPMAPRPPVTALIRRVETAGGRLIFAGDASTAQPPTLQPHEGALHFTFAAPVHPTDFQGRTRTLYRTRLRGFEEAWTEWSLATTREFTNLPARAFSFEVQARVPDQPDSAPAVFAFTLPPPWWLTRWALFAWAAATALILLGLERLRTGALRRKNEKLEAVVAERTLDLRRQNDELARLHRLELDEKISARLGEEKARLDVLRYQLNPHFLFNSLTGIRSQISSANAAAREAVERLTDFCRLTLHGRKPDERSTLGEELAMLRAYLDIEQARLRELLRVEFVVEPGLDEQPLPRLLLLPLVENALKYGQATSTPPLRLRLSVRGAEPGRIAFEIANTGHWVHEPAAHDLPSLGIGHDNLRERLRRHYPNAHTFTHEAHDGWVYVRLELPRA